MLGVIINYYYLTMFIAKIIGAFVGIAGATGLAGCLTDVTYYKHPPTHGLRKEATLDDLKGNEEFIVEGVLFVPDLSEFSPSEKLSRSFLIGYSDDASSVFVSKVVLSGLEGGGRVEIALQKNLEINKRLKEIHQGTSW